MYLICLCVCMYEAHKRVTVLFVHQSATGTTHISSVRACDSREGDNDEKGAIVPLLLHEVRDEGNGLDGLAEAHLVRQNPIQVVVVQGDKPLQPFDLEERSEE